MLQCGPVHTATSLALIGATTAVSALAIWEFRSWWRLRHVPGPFWNSLTVFPLSKLAGTGKISFVLNDMQKKYGTHHGNSDLSPILLEFASGMGIFSTDHLFSIIERKYLSTPTDFRPIDFAHRAQYFTLDVISYLGLGEAFGFLSNDKDMYDYVAINDSTFPIISVLLTIPWADGYMKSWPLNKMLPKDGDNVGFGMLIGVVSRYVENRLASGAEEGTDMLQTHIRNGLNELELKAEIVLELVAGSDSTATAIRVTILALLNTPLALRTLTREIDQGIAAGRISSPIRMNNKQVPKGGAIIHGCYLPEGTQLSINVLHMMRSKETFGPDADVFRPERWIEAAKDEDRYKEMCNVADLAFGYGKYQCLGKVIAAMELNKLFVELLRRYDFSVVTPHKPMVLYDAAFWLVYDFNLRVSRRIPQL
ncbi:cytochrome P450 [Lasiosphaeria hispida]|uniref:Cytochrome P450 n=1 Tax=Lasiosphaeria hispida TaxID=260671 RepID=A0AAJ0HBF3_9PEZI|nr:cytochrome P450 [Lasiosphaeria hispida]